MHIDHSTIIAKVDRDRAKFEAVMKDTDHRRGYTWKHQNERRERLIEEAINCMGTGEMGEEQYLSFIRELMLQAEAVMKVDKFKAFTLDILTFSKSDWKQKYAWYKRRYGKKAQMD
jgi:hypothetical protein